MELRVIKGGLAPDLQCEYEYLKGYVTDTRLMGVLGLHMHWRKRAEGFPLKNVHIFLYYDIEEIGLDYIRCFDIDNPEEVLIAEKACFGGLGAKMVFVNEFEARELVKRFVNGTKEKHQPLPTNISDIDFIIKDFDDERMELSDTRKKLLDRKMCTEIYSDYGTANYYIMRLVGKDEAGAALLRSEGLPEENFDDLSFPRHGTFLQNNIEEFTDATGAKSFLCQSLVDTDDSYFLLHSELGVSDGKVVYAKKKQQFQISVKEASLMLARSEYVSVYEILAGPDAFDADFSMYSVGFTRSEHDFGTMYMQFKPDNSHVDRAHFNLADDIKAIYYVSDYGQLVVGAYSFEDIQAVEKALEKSMVGVDIFATEKYQFAQSIIYDFALSGYTDFAEFVESEE